MKNSDNIIKLNHSAENYDTEFERSENAIGKKIAEARKKSKMTLDTFKDNLADYGVNIAKSSLYKWERGETVPNAYQFMAVCYALNINNVMEYFTDYYEPRLNDEGLKKVSEYTEDLIASGRYVPVKKYADIKYIDMPVSCLAASAGTGAFLDEGNYEIVSYPESSVPKGADFGVRVSGDSMEPVYHDGQIVWVKKCSELHNGDVGIFIYGGDGYIKLYSEKDPELEDAEAFIDIYGAVHKQPVMISFNKKYNPIVISPEMEFAIVGRVL